MGLQKRLVVLVLLVLAAIPVYWLSRDLSDDPNPEEVLPPDTLIFFHWQNFARFAEGVEQSPLAVQMQRKDFTQTLRQLGMDESSARHLEEGKALLQALQKLPFIEELVRHRGMLALLPNRSPDLDLFGSISASLVFILPGDSSDFRKRIENMHAGEAVVENQEYQGTQITLRRLTSGRTLYSCDVHGFSIHAFAFEPLRRCLDQALAYRINGTRTADGRKSWLAEHHVAPREEGEFFFFADAKALRAQPQWGTTLFPLWQGILPQQVVISHSINGRSSGLSATLRFHPEELGAWLHRHQLSGPAGPPLAASQDEATLLHFWTNWFTAEAMDRLTAAINATELGAPLLAAGSAFLAQGSLGRDDFYQQFATELGLVIRGEKNLNAQLKPLFSMYFKTKDLATVQTSLNRLFKSFPLRQMELEHGVKATTIGMAGGMIQPAFALLGDQLILGDNLHMVGLMAKHMRQGAEQVVPVREGRGEQMMNRVSLYLFLRNQEIAQGTMQLLRYLATAKNEKGVVILNARQKLFVEQIAMPAMATIGKTRSSRFFAAVQQGEARATWQFLHE